MPASQFRSGEASGSGGNTGVVLVGFTAVTLVKSFFGKCINVSHDCPANSAGNSYVAGSGLPEGWRGWEKAGMTTLRDSRFSPRVPRAFVPFFVELILTTLFQ